MTDQVERPGRVQLVGPPGIGKSVVARAVLHERMGVWVDLEPERGPGIDAAVARALDVPVEGAALTGVLAEVGLLVLDGAEASGTAVPAWLEGVLAACPRLTVVVTSRVKLDGFRTLDVGPLPPEAAEALFRAEAERVCAGVDLSAEGASIRELVRRFDGLPLAVILAAGKLRLYSPTELLSEEPLRVLANRQVRGRHSSLEGALEVSWALLDAEARLALARIAQVRRWFGRSGFQEITSLPLAVLDRLCDASLVHPVEAGESRRYHLLEPIRAFALRHLAADDPARERYVGGVLARGDEAAARLDRTTAREALARLQDLAPDLHGVVELGGDRAARALLALGRVSTVLGGMSEVAERLATFRRSGPAVDEPRRLQLAVMEADLLVRLRRIDDAGEVLALLGDDPEMDVIRGVAAMREGRQDVSLAHLERARARAAAGEPSADRVPPAERHARVLVAIAATHMERGDFDAAVAVCREGLDLCAAFDRPDLRGLLLRCQATANRLVSHDRFAQSIAMLEEARDLFHAIHNQRFEARTLTSLAVLEADLGIPTAADRVAESLPLLRRTGERFLLQRMELLDGLIALDRGDLDRAARVLEGRPSAVGDPKNRATLDCYLGVLFLLRGDLPAGQRALEAGVAGFDALGMSVDRDLAAHYLAVARCSAPPAPHADRSENLVIANRIAQARFEGRPLDEPLVHAARHDLDLRLMLRITQVAGAAEVAADGSWFRADGVRVDLGRKRVLKRVLRVFAEHEGQALGTDAVLEGAWPGERTAGSSGRARVHVAVSELRKLGLRDALETAPVEGGSGYVLKARIVA
ncbi:MAG: hypothetical protein R3F61_14115 [Myxococcota bacterium]